MKYRSVIGLPHADYDRMIALKASGTRTGLIAAELGVSSYGVFCVLRRPAHFKGYAAREAARALRRANPNPARTPRQKYNAQKSGAAARGIEWGFSFDSWMRVWQESGRWEQRARGGYVMARNGDAGPYAPGNVEIITHGQNLRDANKPLNRANRETARVIRSAQFWANWKPPIAQQPTRAAA